MVVRNEVDQLPYSLGPLKELFDDILVADTGSTDGTQELLRERWQITPLARALEPAQCFSVAAIRNELAARARHPWVLKLDADERIEPAALRAVLAAPAPDTAAGLFVAWETFLPGRVVIDYKLCLARSNVPNLGLVHENLQAGLRELHLRGAWCDALRIAHHPHAARLAAKTDRSLARLQQAVAQAPLWTRYHWFLGYQHYLRGDLQRAATCLAPAVAACSREFPVECLNSHMVSADICARRGDTDRVIALLAAGASFLDTVRDDFEVRVNFRCAAWYAQALRDAAAGHLEAIRAYDFAA